MKEGKQRDGEFFSEHLINNNKDNNNNNKGGCIGRINMNRDDDSEEIELLTKMELIEAIEAIKNNKPSGIDNLSGELIKAGEVETQQQMEIIYSDMERKAHTGGVEDRHHLLNIKKGTKHKALIIMQLLSLTRQNI